MKVKFLTLALILSFTVTSAVICDSVLAKRPAKAKQRAAGIDRWYVFKSPDGDFTLSFPQRPIQEPDEAGPLTAVRTFALRTQKGTQFSVNSQGSFGDPNSPLSNEWNDRYEQALLMKDRENNRRVVHTQRIGKNTFEAEIWDSSSGASESLNYVRQTILRGGRIYTLLCGSQIYGRKLDKSTCSRFFDSMHFISDSRSSRRPSK
jgi:hypothetical protein